MPNISMNIFEKQMFGENGELRLSKGKKAKLTRQVVKCYLTLKYQRHIGSLCE